MRTTPLTQAIEHAYQIRDIGQNQVHPSGESCPMPHCALQPLTDGVYTLCAAGHLCGPDEMRPDTGTESKLFVDLHHYWRETIQPDILEMREPL